MKRANVRRSQAFTLIELMVAVAIIALLVGIMLPTFAGVTEKAKRVATRGTFSALEKGLEFYKGERALGNIYPPAHSDNPLDPYVITNPFHPSGANVNSIVGANLLVYAMTGADQLGTPGFPDTDDRPGWYNNQGSDQGSDDAYELDPNTREPLKPRYPGHGTTYVDDSTRAGIRTLSQLFDDGLLIDDPEPMPNATGVPEQPFFTDAWGRPILYYLANRAGRIPVTNPSGLIGSYDLRDNAFITGCSLGGYERPGLDFGPGKIADGYYHRIAQTETPAVDPGLNILTNQTYENTFERFILDPAVTVQNRAVRPDSYLLISAGADAIYGTDDDVTNWERQ